MAQDIKSGAKEESIKGVGGLKIFARSWRPASKPRKRLEDVDLAVLKQLIRQSVTHLRALDA